MAVPGSGSPLLFSAEAAAPAAGDAKSLRFNEDDSAHLTRSFSSGNRRTWTFSCWMKKSGLYSSAGYQSVFASSNTGVLQFDSIDQLRLYDGQAGGATIEANGVLMRDVSAWYHVVVKYDTTQSTASDRVFIYLNGEDITKKSGTFPGPNYESAFNLNQTHYIGVDGNLSNYFDGYLADVHFIDGQALSPTAFGEVDATTGAWNPIEYAGSYSGNSFHLDFADNSSAAALGYDAAGSNDWTVNNISIAPTGTSYSGAFDGSGDDVRTTTSSEFSFGSGNWTAECWFYLTSSGSYYNPFEFNKSYGNYMGGGINPALGIDFDERISVTQVWSMNSSNGVVSLNQWMHYALVRNGNTITAYLNGTSICSTTYTGSHGTDYFVCIGSSNGAQYFPGYISNVRVVKGTAVYTSSFTPPTSPLTAITNTSLLTLQDSSFVDNSSNNFTLTVNGNTSISTLNPFYGLPSDNDSLFDSPTNGTQTDTGAGGEVSGNYATWNPLDKESDVVLANGNLDITWSGVNGHATASTIAVQSGKWYWEITVGANASVGIYEASAQAFQWPGKASYSYAYAPNGNVVNNASYSSYGTAFSNGDIVGVAFDADNGKLFFSLNGTWQNSGDPAAGTNPAFSGLDTSIAWKAAIGYWTSPTSNVNSANFGQRAFNSTAPSGYKALCTANFDTPIIEDPSTVMEPVLYTGTGSSFNVTSMSFNPDLVWVKCRNAAQYHRLVDSVRGVNKDLITNGSFAEQNQSSSPSISAFNSNGFTVGTDGAVNTNTNTYVAWCWDAGTSTASNTSGSITSSVRANISAGFSVVTYNAGPLAPATGATVGHGLGVAPQFIIVKDRTNSNPWGIYHTSLGPGVGILFNTGAASSYSTWWNNTAPTSSVFSINSDIYATAQPNDDYVAYCWTPVEGYSAFGSYTGNGSTDGPFVYTGFRPAWILVKRTDSGSTAGWTIFDNKRIGYNPDNNQLYPNQVDGDGTADMIDILSNGFKNRTNNSWHNASGGTYIYAAFAESPFAYARAR